MYRILKRCFDVIFALAIIVVISPLMIPIMIALKFTGEGYIFYLQERVGYKNQTFQILKFATMLLDSPNMKGGFLTTKNDPRMTPLGPFLRKTKLNEVPQLLNILKGDMSFVGPRPVMPQSFEKYPQDVQDVIYNVPPGVTGIGSIVFRDEEEIIHQAIENGKDPLVVYAEQIYPYKGELESWYHAKASILLDATLLFCTAWVIVSPRSNLIFRLYPDVPRCNYDALQIE